MRATYNVYLCGRNEPTFFAADKWKKEGACMLFYKVEDICGAKKEHLVAFFYENQVQGLVIEDAF